MTTGHPRRSTFARAAALLFGVVQATWAQTYPATQAASAPAATAFLAQPTVAPGQTVPRPELNRPPGAPAGELVVFRLGSYSQMPGCLAVDKATQRVVFFQAQPPTPPVPARSSPRTCSVPTCWRRACWPKARQTSTGRSCCGARTAADAAWTPRARLSRCG